MLLLVSILLSAEIPRFWRFNLSSWLRWFRYTSNTAGRILKELFITVRFRICWPIQGYAWNAQSVLAQNTNEQSIHVKAMHAVPSVISNCMGFSIYRPMRECLSRIHVYRHNSNQLNSPLNCRLSWVKLRFRFNKSLKTPLELSWVELSWVVSVDVYVASEFATCELCALRLQSCRSPIETNWLQVHWCYDIYHLLNPWRLAGIKSYAAQLATVAAVRMDINPRDTPSLGHFYHLWG
jgi:hypothetical protein